MAREGQPWTRFRKENRDDTCGFPGELYCGTDGLNRYEATLAEEDGRLVWRMRSPCDRFREITLTRSAS